MEAADFSTINDSPVHIRDRNIIVTGGTTGIGRATARLLASQGARVLICGRHQSELDDALRDMPGGVTGITVDLGTRQGVDALFAKADGTFDKLDALVCNAALAAEAIAETDDDTVEYVVRTNLLGYLLCTRRAIQRMTPRKAGHIVYIGSMSADVRAENESTYAATKGGIQAFAEALRKEINKLGIRISLIQPGSVGTDMQPDKPSHPEQTRKLEMMKAEDLATCVAFCLAQPLRADVVTMDVRPHLQAI